MTYQRAINLYLKTSVHGDITVSRLMGWYTGISLRANANKLKITYDQAGNLATKYGLKFKRVGSGNYKKGKL